MNILNEILKGKGKHTAVISRNRKLSYFRLKDEVDKVSSHLYLSNIREKYIVGIISENSVEFIIYLLALWNAGAVPAPLNIRLSSSELEEQINFLGCNAVLRSKSIKSSVDRDNVISFPIESKFESKPVLSSGNLKDTALIMFTSGSSGKPKGVVHSFENLIGSALLQTKFLKQNDNDNWLAALPFYHIGGLMTMMRAFVSGAAIVLPESLQTGVIAQSLSEFNPAFISLVSTQIKRLIDEDIEANPGHKSVLLGGGHIDNQLIKSASAKKWKIIKVYGSTETCSFITALKTPSDNKISSAGKPLPHVRITIDNGEINVEYPFLFLGYYKNEEETRNKIINNIFHTGDMGSLDEEGYLYVNARQNNLIISGGENINPIEIENSILSYKKVKEVHVTGIENKEWGFNLIAVIVQKENFQISDLEDYLREKIAAYKVPKKWFIVEALPRNELGKVEKKKIEELINTYER